MNKKQIWITVLSLGEIIVCLLVTIHNHESQLFAKILLLILFYTINTICLQCFDTCWLGVEKSIRPVKIEIQGVGVVICME